MTRRVALLLLAIATAAAGRNAEVPRATMTAGGAVDVMLPSAILAKREVREQLDSGLTTVFVISMRGNGNVRGGTRVEVRYMLWDEVYAVTTLHGDGRKQQLTLASYDKLAAWWKSATHRLTPDRAATRAASPLKITLEVLPFSAREEADTKRWLSESLGSTRTDERSPASINVLDVIIGTSIQRRPILEYRWTVPLEAAR
jgi:hypothetical protein